MPTVVNVDSPVVTRRDVLLRPITVNIVKVDVADALSKVGPTDTKSSYIYVGGGWGEGWGSGRRGVGGKKEQ